MLTGQTPILVLKEGTKREKGRGALSNNISAAKAIADSVRSTLGPAGDILFVVNCDQNRSVGLDLAGSGFPLSSAGSAWSWGPSSSTPTGSSWSQGGPTSWTLASEGLLLLVSSSPFQLTAAPTLAGASAGASPASLQPSPPGGLPWTSEGLAFWRLSEPPVLLSRGGRLASFL